MCICTDECAEQIEECIDLDFHNSNFSIIDDNIDECENNEIEICAEIYNEGDYNGYSFQWSNGEIDSCTNVFPGSYSVLVSDECSEEYEFLMFQA